MIKNRRFDAANSGQRRLTRGLHLELLKPRLPMAGDTFLINLQPDEATITARYLRDSGEVFGVRESGFTFGWSTDHTDQSRERSLHADQRLDTLIHFEVGQRWEFALPNGNYEVTVAVGDPQNNDGIHTVNVEGTNYWNAVADTNIALQMTKPVMVNDGRLTIDQGAAADKATRINFVHIVGLASGSNAAPAARASVVESFHAVVSPSRRCA